MVDGVFVLAAGSATLMPLPAPGAADLARIATRIAARVQRALDEREGIDAPSGDLTTMAESIARPGLPGIDAEEPPRTRDDVAKIDGFSLHVERAVAKAWKECSAMAAGPRSRSQGSRSRRRAK